MRCSLALGALHAFLDPIVGIDAGRWVYTFGGEANDIHDLRLVLLFVEAVGAVSRLRDSLMTITDSKFDRTRWGDELYPLKRCRHFFGGRLRIAFLRLFVGYLQS